MHDIREYPRPYPPRLYPGFEGYRRSSGIVNLPFSYRYAPMGNTSSSVASNSKESRATMNHEQHSRPIHRPPEAVHLDFDNMPFLQPPQESGRVSPRSQTTYPGTPLPPAPSPPLSDTHYSHFEPTPTRIQGFCSPRIPSEGCIDHTVHDMDFFASPPTSPRQSSSISANDDSGGSTHHSQSSITSQLSTLSQQRSSHGSPHGSPRSHRYSFSDRISAKQVDTIDAGVPPPVPPHLKFPDYIASKYDIETETALAAVDALEEDFDPKGERKPLRSRSRSLSRSLTRRKSLGSESVVSGKSMTTDIYTRKCSSPTLKFVSAQESPESPSSLLTHKSSETDNSIQEPESPCNADDSLFSLEGYHEGTTKLRVVNLDKDGANLEDGQASDVIDIEDAPHKFFIKSKAQLAEEEEHRLNALRKRYERYGHRFTPKDTLKCV